MRKTEKSKNREIGYVKPREIIDEVKESYIDYAMSVIVARALPDVRDGLKPVHRKILYAMYEDGLTYNAKFRKAATVVGSTLGRYHPHGDVALYDSLVRMAQDFSLRYPLIQGQGNFGSIDGDPPAAMRYTEARLSKIGQEMLKDIEKNTVDFVPNYDGTRKEPAVLPSPMPQLLLNGSLGIAVGMATNIPPHNLSEVCDACVYLLDNPKATTEDLFQFIQGPDFPTGGEIFNKREIITAYSQGKGPILMRGKAEIIEDDNGGKSQIIIEEIPFQVQKSALVSFIAKLVEEKRIVGVKDIRDESDKEGLRIVIDLAKDAFPRKILNQIYKFTDLQKNFHLNMLALVDGIQPKVLSLPEVFAYFLVHKKEVIIRRTKYELEKAKQRAHILEGLQKCLANIDEVIRIIKKSENREAAKNNLMNRFRLTEIQANAILETKLSALARLERKKIEDELKQIMEKIKELTAILQSPQKVKNMIKQELGLIKETFGSARKTRVYVKKADEISETDLIPQQETIVVLTKTAYVKRINPATYKIQKRGGRGILGMKTVGEDVIEHFVYTNTHDFMLFFTDSGKVFRIPVYEVPEGTRVSKGRALVNFLEISAEETVLALIPARKEDADKGIKYFVMVTKNGIIKKTPYSDFENIRKNGLIAISLKKGDALMAARKTTGKDEIMLVTARGQSIRFGEGQIKPMGRPAAGVKGIRLKKGDEVMGIEIIQAEDEQKEKPQDYLLVVTEKGFGKRTNLQEYRIQNRGGSGIKTAQVTSRTGSIVAAKILKNEEDLIVISAKAQVIKTKINSISKSSRATQGVKLIRLGEGDRVASVACI